MFSKAKSRTKQDMEQKMRKKFAMSSVSETINPMMKTSDEGFEKLNWEPIEE
jgi:hypothetical protein